MPKQAASIKIQIKTASRRFAVGAIAAAALALAACNGIPGDILPKSKDAGVSVKALSQNAGSYPYAGLIEAKDGNLYGTTYSGGAHNLGTVIKAVPGEAPVALYSFGATADAGAAPYAGLVQDADGNLYGTTSEGGANGKGIVYRITTAGALTTLHDFGDGPADGATPSGGLALGTDGSFYGTTQAGGLHGGGTVYRISPSGLLVTLHSFGGEAKDAAGPYAGLTLAKDGNFYGTTPLGGANNEGTVYRVSKLGVVTIIYSFSALADDSNTDGALPYGDLLAGSDGNLYGTTSWGGGKKFGTVFRITPGGSLSTVHTFSGADGAYPRAGLVDGGDGYYYGTASGGGPNNLGTAFRVAPGGGASVVHVFGSGAADSASPYGALAKTVDGALFGTSLGGGAGTIFKLK